MLGNTKFTVTEAINKIRGMNRKRFYEMLDNGEISFETERWGKRNRKIIDGSELARVFGSDFMISETTNKENENNPKQLETEETFIKNRLLEQKIEFLHERLEDKDKQIEEKNAFISNLSGKLDKAQVTIERQTYLLESKKNDNFSELDTKPKFTSITNPKEYNNRLINILAVALTIFCLMFIGYQAIQKETKLKPPNIISSHQ